MKANSKELPVRLVDLGGRWQFNYDVKESIDLDDQSNFDFKYVILDQPTKEAAIRALIKERYSLDDEIALINNYNQGNVEEYNAYQAFRLNCKSIAGEVFE